MNWRQRRSKLVLKSFMGEMTEEEKNEQFWRKMMKLFVTGTSLDKWTQEALEEVFTKNGFPYTRLEHEYNGNINAVVDTFFNVGKPEPYMVLEGYFINCEMNNDSFVQLLKKICACNEDDVGKVIVTFKEDNLVEVEFYNDFRE